MRRLNFQWNPGPGISTGITQDNAKASSWKRSTATQMKPTTGPATATTTRRLPR
ncbi:unnamed protein product [Cyprideis torosa]|uniref:Uncharacterized protein n=1 Tax=Cyprideis torosa TaxID=163714 RepID=A0A7R8WWG6_9CRUS|nr:unnamed protein product [Cyprideis torosa]CAG0907938.1 unnamed protein product [Cyprideis torosa]